jgi:hypothetical protein
MRVRSSLPFIATFLVAVLLLSACLGIGQPTPTQVSVLEYTQAAETIVAELTESASQVTPTTLSQAAVTTEAIPATSTSAPTETLPPTSTPQPTDTPFPTDTPTPAFTATSTYTATPAWRLVYEDDLKSGYWINEKTDDFRLQYSMGGYMISSDIEKDIAYSVRNDAYGNVRVEVTGKRVSGPLDGYYGIICNFANGGNYYFLGIGADGWYGIGIKQAGQIRFLEEGKDTSGTVQMADVDNKIRAECAFGRLTLWVNDVQLATAQDRSFTAGKIGLGVGNRDAIGTSIVFQNFMVYLMDQGQ